VRGITSPQQAKKVILIIIGIIIPITLKTKNALEACCLYDSAGVTHTAPMLYITRQQSYHQHILD